MIKGEHIFLRPLEPEDLELLYLWENNPDNWKISQTLMPFSKHILEKFIDSGHDIFIHNQVRWIIARDHDMALGTLDFFDFDPINLRAGIGILINDIENRGKGYGSEAIELGLRYAFDHLMLESVYCNVLESNESSLKLFKKAGFEEIGLKKNWIRTREGWENEYLLQKLRS